MDCRGLALIASGVALSVFGFQQSSVWGWHNPATAACVVAGVALLVVFFRVEARTMLGPASTDVVNRASRLSYGEATGITQTVRNYAASFGLAILGTVLVSEMTSHVTSSLVARGLSRSRAAAEAASLSQAGAGARAGSVGTAAIPQFIRLDFAQSIHVVLLAMAAVMAVAAVVAFLGLQRGVQQEEPATATGEPAPESRAA
jgi:hypothetical protein